MTKVLIAPDKFKGSLTAAQVAESVEAGLRRVLPDIEVTRVPVADGGDGTLAAAVSAGFTQVAVTATGPTGEGVDTAFARQRDLAVVELADVSGLARLPVGRPSPLRATSRGTGEVMAAALDAGCRDIVLGIGGSACTDGGAGLVQALGAHLLDADGQDIATGGESLHALATVDLAHMQQRLADVTVTVACDVDNPLTGPDGAAAVYGPQKGASAPQITDLDQALTHWADVVANAVGADHRDTACAGAAGGVGFAALSLLGATLQPGIDLVLNLVGFHERLNGVDLVITGEGALDDQTLHGKAPAGVAAAARTADIPVVAVCGHNTLDPGKLHAAGISAAYALRDLEPDIQHCIQQAGPLLTRLGGQIAADYLRH